MSEQDVNGMHNERTEDFLTELIPPEESNMTTPVLLSDGAEKDNSSEVNPDDLYEGVRAPKLLETPAEEPVSKADNDAEVSESFKGPLFKEEDLVEAVDEIKSPVLSNSVKQETEFKEPVLKEPDLQDLSDPLAYSAREKALASRQLEDSQKSHRPVLVSDDDALLSLEETMSVDSKKEKHNKKHSSVENPEDGGVKAPLWQGNDDDFISEYADIGADKQAPVKKTPVKKEDASNMLAGTHVGLLDSGSGSAGPGETNPLGKIEEGAKKATETAKQVGRKSSVKSRLQNKKGVRADWTNVAGAVKKSQDDMWKGMDSLEDVASKGLDGFKGALGSPNDLKANDGNVDYDFNDKDFNKVEGLGKSGANTGYAKGREGLKSAAGAPVNGADRVGHLYNRKKQIERLIAKRKEKLAVKDRLQKQAVEAQKTAATASRVRKANAVVKTGQQAANAATQTGIKGAQIGAKASKEVAKHTTRAAVKTTEAAAKTTVKTVETSAKASAAAGKTAASIAKAASGPWGWLLLLIEIVLVFLFFVLIIVMLLFFIVSLEQPASGIDEEGLATSQQRVEFQQHLFTMLKVYHDKGKNVLGWSYYNAALAAAEFDPSVLNNISATAKAAYGDDTWGKNLFSQGSAGRTSIGNISTSWCAHWATYAYQSGGWDYDVNSANRTAFNRERDYTYNNLFVLPSNGCTYELKWFISKQRAAAWGGLISRSASYTDFSYFPTVGDYVFKVYFPDGHAGDWDYVKPFTLNNQVWYKSGHAEIVLSVDYNKHCFYTVCGNGSQNTVCIRKYVVGGSSPNHIPYIEAFGRVFSRPAEAYPAAPT